MINITEDRLRWLVRERKYLTLDGAVEIAKAAPDLLAEIERLGSEVRKLRDVLTWSNDNCPGKCAGPIRADVAATAR